MKEKLIQASLASTMIGIGASWAVDVTRTNGPLHALMVMFLVGVGAMVAQCNILWAIDDAAAFDEEDSFQPESEASDDE